MSIAEKMVGSADPYLATYLAILIDPFPVQPILFDIERRDEHIFEIYGIFGIFVSQHFQRSIDL